MYFRGPAGVPFFFVPFLTLLGIWKFSRIPHRLCDVGTEGFIGGRVLGVCSYLGSYGMGGAGFVGLKVRRPDAGVCWIVFAVWGAAGWLTVNGSACHDGYFEDERKVMAERQGSPLPSLLELKGGRIDAIRLAAREFSLHLSHKGILREIRLLADSGDLPVFRGSKEPRVMGGDEDLRDAILVSRRAHLWL